MTKTKGFLLAVAVAAMAFTFSCSSGDDNSGGGGDPSSSSGGTQGGGGSSSSDGGGGNACTDLEPITIGSQTWAKKNLDCDVAGSKCYDNDPAYCTAYGRLYDWATALTACPSGWHLPSRTEWEVMTAYIGGAETEGAELKATSGWQDDGNGTDNHDFTAMPGGIGNLASGELSVGSFLGVGSVGGWWSTDENRSGSSYAYGRLIRHNQEDAEWESYPKAILLSIRCIKD